MTVAVTGADGFAGSHLVDFLLGKGENVVACIRATPLKNLVPNRKMRVAYVDLLDYRSLADAFWGCEKVYHLGAVSGIAESRAKENITAMTNVVGTQNVLKACLEDGVKKVHYCSTCHVAGFDVYAASKRAAEAICEAYSSKIPILVTRAHNHYGPRQRPEWVIMDFVDKAVRGLPIVVNSPSVSRDFTYVTDIVAAYWLLMRDVKLPHSPIEIGSGVSRTMREVAETVKAVSGYSGEIQYGSPRAEDMAASVADVLVCRGYGWYPFVDFEDGIRRTVDWCRQRLGSGR